MRCRLLRHYGLVGLLAATALAGCGRGDSGPLRETDRAMAALDAGQLDFALAATANSEAARPVGFRMQGAFASEENRKYPTLDMRYTTLLGDAQRITRVVSDGHTIHVIQDGAKTEVSPDQARLLQLGRGQRGFTDLGVSGWAKETTVVERPDGTRLVTGSVDVADLLSDLTRVSAQTGGGGTSGRLDRDSARRLQRLVRNSEFTAELDRAGLPRTLRAVVDFGRDLPAELRTALGSYASPRFEVTLAVDAAEH